MFKIWSNRITIHSEDVQNLLTHTLSSFLNLFRFIQYHTSTYLSLFNSESIADCYLNVFLAKFRLKGTVCND